MIGPERDLIIAPGTVSYIIYELFRSRAGGEGRSDEDEQVDDEDNEGIINGGDGYVV